MTNITVKLAHLEAASAQDFTAVDLAKKTPYLPGRTVTAHFIATVNFNQATQIGSSQRTVKISPEPGRTLRICRTSRNPWRLPTTV